MIDTLVIGAGQAGLASSYHLGRVGIEHVVLERGRVAETWRTARWDGFHLNTPNWATQLPGIDPPGADPDAFAPLSEVIALLDEYARRIEAPVRTGVEVTALGRRNGCFELRVDGESMQARSVVVATGAFQQPTAPKAADEAPGGVVQLHTCAYRRSGDLSAGGVLIIGSGQSGCEIAQELLDVGRDVHLAVGRCPWAPRRYRGRELVRWMIDLGLMDDTADVLSSPAARLAGNVTVSGARGGVDCNPLLLEEAGAHLHGHLTGFRDGRAVFADDLDENLTKGVTFERELCLRCDEYARAAGLDLPPQSAVERKSRTRVGATELALEQEGIGTVLWANGFRPSFAWIDLPVFDNLGFPRTTRGVTEAPGLAFVGLPWLHTRKSPLLLGVGEDAAHVADALAVQLGRA